MTRAQELLSGFVHDCPPCMIFYGPKDCGQIRAFQEYFKNTASVNDLYAFQKPKLDELLELNAWLMKRPEKRYRVVLIEQGNEISKEASNFLLKVIEDAPEYVRWVILTDTRNVLGPLVSRSFMIPFRDTTNPLKTIGIDVEKTKKDLTDALKSKSYPNVYLFCQGLRNVLAESEETVERDVYLFCCDVAMEVFSDYRKLNRIQKTKTQMRRGIHCEQLFKVMVLETFYESM